MSKVRWCSLFGVALLISLAVFPGRTWAQSATVTDDAFLSSNTNTQQFNLNGQGISLIVAGSSATVGNSNVGATKTYIKFLLTSSLPPNTAASNVAKATLKLYLSPLTKPSGAIDIYPLTSAWTESTLNASSPPTLASTAFAAQVPVGQANSFLVVDVTKLVQEWLNGSANGGIDNDGIALVADTSTSYVVFDSKESIVTSHEPRLEIVLVNSGPQGPAGPQGPQGATGGAGAAGTAATVTVGTTGTGLPGTKAMVTNASNNPSAALLNFLIPQGPTGAQGPAGPQGPQGLVGPQGSPGAPGAAGPAGANGLGFNFRKAFDPTAAYALNDVVSFNGSSYVALAATKPGDPTPDQNPAWSLAAQQGATGPQGQPGAQGPQGIQGAMGLPGLPGPPGPMPTGAALTTTPNSFAGSQTINGNLILTGSGAIQFADGTSQATASTGGTASCPAAFEVSSTSPLAPSGYTPLNQITAGNVWFSMAPMPTARFALAAAVDATGKIYAIGGVGSAGAILSTMEVYNPATNGWSPAASMPTARAYLAAAADTTGKVYAIGGSADGQSQLSTVEVYNPATNSWSTAASMPSARWLLAAAADAKGNIYAIGGFGNGGYLSAVEVYNPATSSWNTAASMPTARAYLAAVADGQGKIYAMGGTAGIGTLSTMEVYNPATNIWSTLANMPTSRGSLAAAADTQGKIYAIGGSRPGLIPSTVEVYNPATNGWSPAASMPTARVFLAAAADTQGKIYAIGGNSTGPTNTVEQYSPPVTIYTFIKN
jgi:N-acetylneuraminic acid mutarotase